jgi:hypothetical protein
MARGTGKWGTTALHDTANGLAQVPIPPQVADLHDAHFFPLALQVVQTTLHFEPLLMSCPVSNTRLF